jgi:hypothetical protein
MTTESHAAHAVAAGIALLGLAYLAACIAPRVGSPWPLEWMEGASALHAQRLVAGLPLYAAARADFVPFVYPPLSYVAMALGLWLADGALWGARLSSVVALVLCVVALSRAGTQLGGSRAPGWLAAGLFAFGYGYTGAFSDVARVDAWFCALSLWGVERLSAERPRTGLALLALACFAKQHALLLLAAGSAGVLFEGGRRSLPGVLAVWAGLALGGAGLYVWSDGWIWTYCVSVPAGHGLRPSLLLSFLLVDLGVYLPVLVGLCVYWLSTRRGPQHTLVGLLLMAAIAASALGRAHPGGDDNVRLPAFALSALVAALGCGELLRSRPQLRWVVLVGLVVQVAMLVQSPALHWPSAQTAQGFEQLQAELRRCAAGDDYAAMDHAGLGGHPFVHTLALSDLRMNGDGLAEHATQQVLLALQAESAPRAFAISASFPALMQVLAEHYALCGRIAGNAHAYRLRVARDVCVPVGRPLALTCLCWRGDSARSAWRVD